MEILIVLAHLTLAGLGVLQTGKDTKHDTADFMDYIFGQNLCVLNTWQSRRPTASATYVFNEQPTQIDFLLTRRVSVDLQAKRAQALTVDLVPWRLGSKHGMVKASLRLAPVWTPGRKPMSADGYDRRALENPGECFSVQD